MHCMSLSRVLRNLYISPIHVLPLTTRTMYNDCIYYNTDNTSQYTEHITICKIPQDIYRIHRNIQNISQYTKIHHNTSDTEGDHVILKRDHK